MTRVQCKKCPWRVTTDPHEIPNGYCEAKHAALTKTIASPGDTSSIGLPLRTMACHESMPGRELPCVGWLIQQLGPGNNIALRLAVANGRIDADVRAVGEQHQRIEDTLL